MSIVLLVVVLAAEPAGAQTTPDDPCGRDRSNSGVVCDDELTGDGTTPGRAPSGTARPGVTYVPYERVATGPDGQPCVTTGYHPLGSPRPADASPGIAPDPNLAPGLDAFDLLYQNYPQCPPSPSSPAGAPDTPGQYAARLWEQIPLPTPAPTIAPGWAIVGKLAYLETHGQTRYVYSKPSTPFGPLEIVATGRYHVDWGDGDSSGPHGVEGRAWPDGEIKHDYQWSGTYDVVVTERWTATWSLGGRSGILRELRTEARIEDFPARQIQAVIVR